MKKLLKGLTALTAALTISLSGVQTAQAGTWMFIGPENWKWEYHEEDGTHPASSWKMIDGFWYHFDSNGYLDIGCRQVEEGGPYYYMIDSDGPNLGKMATSGEWEYGYIQPDGTFYCYYPEYADPYTATGPVMLYDPNIPDESIAYDKAVRPSTADWYNQAFFTLSNLFRPTLVQYEHGETYVYPYNECRTCQCQLPQNWKEVCPSPFMDKLILTALKSPVQFYGWVSGESHWTIDENGLLTVNARIWEVDDKAEE